jgi:intracellular sulfur oxidation DsrE/DsrF family protein
MTVAVLTLCGSGLLAHAALADGSSVTMAIPGYGGPVRDMPHAAYKPDPSLEYKEVFTVIHGAKTPGEASPYLPGVARAVYQFSAAGVPLSHRHFVAVIAGDATPIVLDNEHHRQRLGVDNPNLALIAALRKAGVDVVVCDQAVAEHKYELDWVDKSVAQAFSAMTTVIGLQQQGYALIAL